MEELQPQIAEASEDLQRGVMHSLQARIALGTSLFVAGFGSHQIVKTDFAEAQDAGSRTEASTTTTPTGAGAANSEAPTITYHPPSTETMRRAQRLVKKCSLNSFLAPGTPGGMSRWAPDKKHRLFHVYARKNPNHEGQYIYNYRIMNPKKYKFCGSTVYYADLSMKVNPKLDMQTRAKGEIIDNSTSNEKTITQVTFLAIKR